MKPIDMMVTDLNAEYLGIPRLSLMENAGKAVAQEINKLIDSGSVTIFAGTGGNGGDGFVAARHLLNMGFKVEVILLAHPSRVRSEEAKKNWEVLEKMKLSPAPLELRIIRDSSQLKPPNTSVIVDAILGTGIKGRLREPIRSAIKLINKSKALKVAVDIPSGVEPETGEVADVAVEADYTVTFHRMKDGLKMADPTLTGEIIVSDIGIPPMCEIFTGPGDLLRLPKRKSSTHKGENGRILIIGGSAQYSGAPALAGLAALKSGADLVTIACPESAMIPIKSYSPDLIVKGFPGDHINTKMLKGMLKMVERVDCILIGCGGGLEPETGDAFNLLVQEIMKMGKPIVIDADGLKLIKKDTIKDYHNIILTPHEGEFKKFFSLKSPIIIKDFKEKVTAYHSIANNIKGLVLLKGPVDMIFQGEKVRLNTTGTPGMTVGGTGDCLAGITASLWAQGLSTMDAAALAAFINGRAGELAEEEYGYGFTASEMIDFIPRAMSIPSTTSGIT
ncbi:MAG: NAD(P)H-hydrate dehydratase [Methanothermobacter sp.]|nr:NAD(P)H-hydrate dehydratase [Methanothermobacter sp.]